MNKTVLLMLFASLFTISKAVKAQKTVLPEIGFSYFTNTVETPNTRLYDFIGFTINPRVVLAKGSNYSFSLDVPLSVRSKSEDDRTTKLGLFFPALGVFNYGAGSVGESNSNALGFTAGIGWAYFYQSARSGVNEMPQYKESLSSTGPLMQAGIRIPHRRVTLFRYKDSRAYPVAAIKVNYLVNIKSYQKSIGSVSFLIGPGF